MQSMYRTACQTKVTNRHNFSIRQWNGSRIQNRPIQRTFALERESEAESILRTASEEVSVVVLKRGCSTFIERGNHLVFLDSIKEVIGRGPNLGDQVILSTPNRRLLGWGVFNPNSIYRVRVLQTLTDCQTHTFAILNYTSVFEVRVKEALELRKTLQLPNAETNVFRLVNSDGDKLSGVIVDVLNDVAVVHSGVAWIELHRESLIQILKRLLSISTVVWRLRPVIREQEGVPDAQEGVYSSDPEITMESRVCVKENGVEFEVKLSGQKTGFYSDQRENRDFLRRIAKGKEVLDLCCYIGCFGIYAALGGAKSVLGIDSSKSAVELATENARRNGVHETCVFQCGDILNTLQVAAHNNEQWGVVILDPPKLAFRSTQLQKALARYRKLNRAAMKVVKKGGLLLTCSCSGSVTLEQFRKTVVEAAENLGFELTILRVTGAAPDHVFIPSHPEGDYLKCLTVRVN